MANYRYCINLYKYLQLHLQLHLQLLKISFKCYIHIKFCNEKIQMNINSFYPEDLFAFAASVFLFDIVSMFCLN